MSHTTLDLTFPKGGEHTMSFNIDSNLRLELGCQRQAELLQQAQRDKRERALLAEIAHDPGLQPHRSRSFLHLRRNRQALPREAR